MLRGSAEFQDLRVEGAGGVSKGHWACRDRRGLVIQGPAAHTKGFGYYLEG